MNPLKIILLSILNSLLVHFVQKDDYVGAVAVAIALVLCVIIECE